MIKVEVHSTRAVIRSQEPLTVGLRGAKVRFAFGGDWENLGKTAVFRQGEKTVTVADIGQEVTIPWEVLTMAGVPVQIGVYGMNASGTVAIPTLWVSTEPVQPGADPEGDPTTEYTQPFWEQILQKTGTLEQLQTDAKSSLVAAINEANRPVQMVYVGMDTDGFNTSHFANEIQRLIDNGIPMACYWHEKDVVAHLSEFQTGGPFVFTTVSDAVAYRIVIHDDNSVECSEMELTKKTDLPTKTSQLKNDSGYLTKAPVTGVNGQTGDVTVSTPVRIMIERLDNGLYQPDPPYDEIVELHDQGNLLYCQYENLELPLTSAVPHFYTFSCVHDGKVHKVRIGPSSVTASSESLASGGGSGAMDAVLYKPQTLTEEQKTQARDNIGACDKDYVDNAISNIDVPAGGNNATYRHIATVVFDENTNVAHWKITQDADGNDLSLSHVFIRGDVTAADRKGDGELRFNGDAPIPWVFTMNTSAYTGMAEIKMVGTTVLAQYMHWTSSPRSEALACYYRSSSSSVISSIQLGNAANVPIPSGSKFEVWGY